MIGQLFFYEVNKIFKNISSHLCPVIIRGMTVNMMDFIVVLGVWYSYGTVYPLHSLMVNDISRCQCIDTPQVMKEVQIYDI